MSGQPPTTFLHLVCLTSVFLLGSFSLLAFAAGLLWLADSLEHNPVGARRWGRGLVYVVIAICWGLYLIDGYPLQQTLLSVTALLVYLRVIILIPSPSLSRPTLSLILSILLLPVTHLSWYNYFLSIDAAERKRRPVYGRQGRENIAAEKRFDSLDRVAFYAVVVWLVPFFVFLSLSSTPQPTNQDTPTLSNSEPPTSLFTTFLSYFLPKRYFASKRDRTEGLLAIRPSALPHLRPPQRGPSPLDPNGGAPMLRRVASATHLQPSLGLGLGVDLDGDEDRVSIESSSVGVAGSGGGSVGRRSGMMPPARSVTLSSLTSRPASRPSSPIRTVF